MQVIIKQSHADIADLVSEKFLRLIRNKPTAVLGLATGSTPIASYQALIRKLKSAALSVSQVTTFNLDEYVGLHDLSQSYQTFMDENLFKFLDFNPKKHHFPSEQNLGHYDQMIVEHGGIDLQILGIGPDGHIAFNEPGTPFDSKTHLADLEESTRVANARFFSSLEEVPTKAVSMGLATIMAAREIVLIATGSNKADAVRSMLAGVANLDCPASVLNSHSQVTIYLDEEAAARLY